MTLPESYISATGSPVPIILGVNQDLEFFHQNYSEQKLTNFIVISIDDDNIFMTSNIYNDLMSCAPQFGTYREKLKSLYALVNSDISNNFSLNGRKKLSCKKTNKEVKDVKKKLIYTPTIGEETSCEKIIEGFKELLDKNIVQKLTPNPIYSKDKQVYLFY